MFQLFRKKSFLQSIRLLFIVQFLYPAFSQTLHAEGIASQLFSKFKQQVFQVKVIDIASGNKNSIGSGFQLSKDGHLATNFHVVSSYVHEPEKYRLEYVAHDGRTGDIQLLDVDVIHDLAITRIKPLQKKYFRFSQGSLSKGERIFSMGDPHDLSMLIIEGNYNGLVKESRYQKILFSGSLNPGMSGGPAFDDRGRIIGVNVAKGGEQLSFLVPVSHLEKLYKRVKKSDEKKDFQKVIETDLVNDQQLFYSALNKKEWKSDKLGEVTITAKLDESLKCWGHTIDKDTLYYKGVHKHCQSQDRIYISRSMQTGHFSYDYEWITTDRLNRIQFYKQVEKRFSHARNSSVSKEEDATNYKCNDDFVSISGHSWKVSSCIRGYKKYSGLYDILYMMAMVDYNDKVFIAKAAMSGVSRENSMAFIKRFMGAVQWKN